MEGKYTAKDIIEMAVKAKEKGAELYLALARNSENFHVGQFFTELAKDEHRHKMQIEKWLESLSPEKREEAYPGERSMYLKAMVDDNTFRCDMLKKQALQKTISEETALAAGITFEKDFMLFLHDLKRNVPEKDQVVVEKLIDEEICHLKEMFVLSEKIKR
ncbi:MAG: ferritin family protein [Candidatus Omnitrophota bacterium]